MDYEQKYKEALERANKVHKYSSDPAEIKRMEDIFPELAESEDEKTRKALISFLKSPFVNENITDEKVAPWLAWLEKLKVFTEHGDGLYHFGNSEFTYVGNPTWDNVSFLEKQETSYTKRDVEDAYVEGMAFAKDELEKQKSAWSEEDDSMFQSCIGAVATNDYYKGEEKEQIYDWLKSLKQRIGG